MKSLEELFEVYKASENYKGKMPKMFQKEHIDDLIDSLTLIPQVTNLRISSVKEILPYMDPDAVPQRVAYTRKRPYLFLESDFDDDSLWDLVKRNIFGKQDVSKEEIGDYIFESSELKRLNLPPQILLPAHKTSWRNQLLYARDSENNLYIACNWGYSEDYFYHGGVSGLVHNQEDHESENNLFSSPHYYFKFSLNKVDVSFRGPSAEEDVRSYKKSDLAARLKQRKNELEKTLKEVNEEFTKLSD